METLLGVAVGLGLSAACGFRVFVPLLAMNLASLTGHLHLASGFTWIGNSSATVAFATATIIEVFGYYIPWLDHALDVAATPAAVIAGTLATASLVTDMSPFLKGARALIAGDGIAGLVQATTVTLRTAFAASAAGTGNPLVSTLGWAGSIIISLLAILVPMPCAVLIGFFCVLVIRNTGRFLFAGTSSSNYGPRAGFENRELWLKDSFHIQP